ncbi:MAG: hypothetical protein HY881_19135 [Deltaproteobacteria bacterium]|nr:hypothetical protein [Deltaproteobacteria bacterium]
MQISDNFLKTKTENTLELKERLSKRIFLMLLLVLSGITIFFITFYEKPSCDPRSDIRASYLLYSFGGILVFKGILYFLGRVSIRVDKLKGVLFFSTMLRDFFSNSLQIKIAQISHIQIETLPGGKGPDYDVVRIITDKKDILVYSGHNVFLVNNLSRSMADFIGCQIFYNSKV